MVGRTDSRRKSHQTARSLRGRLSTIFIDRAAQADERALPTRQQRRAPGLAYVGFGPSGFLYLSDVCKRPARAA